ASLYDSGISFLHPHLANFYADGSLPKRTGNAHPNIAPYDTYQTGDEPIFLAIGNNRQFGKLCELLEAPEIATDPRFEDNAARCGHRPELRVCLEEQLQNHACNDLAQKLIQSGVPCGPVQDLAALVGHPHTEHRGMVVDIGEYRGTASPIKLSRTPPTYRSAPPQQGENSRAVLTRLGIDEATQDRLLAAGVIQQAE